MITKDLHRDPKPFWRWLKNIRGSHHTIPDIHYQGNILSSASEKANALNNFFTSVFTKEVAVNVSNLRQRFLLFRSAVEIKDVTFSANDVYDLICATDPSKSSGPDNIPGRLYKEGAQGIAEPLAKLFNLSMSSGQLPRDWTRANITPVFKKGSKHLPNNYRPVSLTSLVVKTMERLVYCELSKHLTEHHKLCSTQHGFRRGHSCQTQLLETIHRWAKSLDERSSTHVIFLDFSKAFDTVPHKKLCIKLDNKVSVVTY